MAEFQGQYIAKDLQVAIVVSRFNESITKLLVQGAVETFQRYGVSEKKITTVWVPGAFEIPIAAKKMALTGDYDAVVCLGCVIRGSTPHFDYVCSQNASGIMHVGLETGIPTIYGVLTTNTLEEAIERSGTKAGNKGIASAHDAVEMVDLFKQLSKGSVKKEIAARFS